MKNGNSGGVYFMKPFSIRLFSCFFFDESRKKECQQRKYGDYKNNLIKITRMDNKEQVSLIQHLGEWETIKGGK